MMPCPQGGGTLIMRKTLIRLLTITMVTSLVFQTIQVSYAQKSKLRQGSVAKPSSRAEVKETPGQGTEQISIEHTPLPNISTAEFEPNDTSGQATSLTFSPTAIMTAAINPGGDVDFYTFTAPAGSRVWLETDTGGLQNAGANDRDTVIDLLAADGTTVIENDDDDGTGNGGDGTVQNGNASLIAGRTLVTGGTYFIRVRGFNTDDVINPYRLFVVVTNVAPTAEVEAN